MRILYDSKQPQFKTPFGTLTPGQVCTLHIHIPTSVLTTKVTCVFNHEDGSWAQNAVLAFQMKKGAYDVFEGQFSIPCPGLFFYYFVIDTQGGSFRLFKQGDDTNMEAGDLWQLSCIPADFTTPDWAKGAIIYQIFPDRFHRSGKCNLTGKLRPYTVHRHWDEDVDWAPDENGIVHNNDFFGGNFRGITEKMDYIASLGTGIIYLNPIGKAFSNHRYDTGDYKIPDPMLGTEADFRDMCDAAHARGMKVILDGVYSHTGSNSLYFDRERTFGGNGAYCRQDSPFYHWYTFYQWPNNYHSWWNFDTLPTVNKMHPDFIRYVITDEDSVVAHWMKLGADGFRLDVADELPDDFIEKIRAAVKSHGEDKLLLGEVWEDATTKEAFGRRRTYLRGHGLDAVMNYPFRSATLDYLHGADVTAVADALMQICEHYPAPALNCAMNFLSTHDTERAITAIAGEPCNNRDRYWQSKRVIPSGQMDEAIRRLLLGYAMIFTLPGVPCVYYGDEIAMQGYRDPFNRAFFDWNSTEQRLRGPLKTLAALRRSCDAFDGGRLEIVRAEGDILHYRRVGVVQTAEIILNRGPHLIAEEAFGKNTEVNPGGFTVLVEDNHPEHVGYFSVY